MKTRELVGALCVMALAAGAASAQGAKDRKPTANADGDQSVSCYVDARIISDAQERQRLGAAPHGARRASAHVLVVDTAAGARRFVDRRPEAVELDRFHWSYCGYIPALKAHLIGLEDGGDFTGKLLLDRSGRELGAGSTVVRSPDGKLFLAGSQVNGEYLGRWMLSDLQGRQLWAGVSGITGNPDIEFGDPVWIANDVLRAPAECNDRSRKAGEATLAREGGTWRWKTDLRCGG